MAAEMKLVLIRPSRTLPFGMDLIDSRDGVILAWARIHPAHFVTARVNETYPDPDLAPDQEALALELASHLVDSDGAGDEDTSVGGFMVPRRERL